MACLLQLITPNFNTFTTMKKILLLLMLISTTGIVTAQNYADESYRAQKRAERRAEFMTKLNAGIAAHQFFFTATTMQGNVGGDVSVPFQNNYVDVYPSTLDVDLPYITQYAIVNTPSLINFTASSYTVSTAQTDTNWIVVIQVNNQINDTPEPNVMNMSYTLHFSIYKSTGLTTLTITPSMSDAVTYEGFVTTN